MNRRGAGISFFFIAAFIFVMRYLIVAVDQHKTISDDVEFFMPKACLISIIIGVMYLWSSYKEENNII